MTEHSPGPWWAKTLHRRSSDRIIYDANERLVAHVWVGEFSAREEGLANLRLILLAPSLWALLQEQFEWYCSDGIGDKCQDCYDELDCPLLKAQALFDGVGGS